MNIADLIKVTGRKREFDFFSKVAYICDNFGENRMAGGDDVNQMNYYLLSNNESEGWTYFLHVLPDNFVIIDSIEGATAYFLNEKDYSSRQFNPIIPEGWEKMVEDILESRALFK